MRVYSDCSTNCLCPYLSISSGLPTLWDTMILKLGHLITLQWPLNSQVEGRAPYLSLYCIFCLFFFFFFGHFWVTLWHTEVPRLGGPIRAVVLVYAGATATQDPSRVCNPHTAHGKARSSTHWARPGMEIATSWFLVGFANHWAMKGTPHTSHFKSKARND